MKYIKLGAPSQHEDNVDYYFWRPLGLASVLF